MVLTHACGAHGLTHTSSCCIAQPQPPNGAPGSTALHCAVAAGQPEAAAVLLASGASLAKEDPQGRTPLQVAAAMGHLPVFQLLLEVRA